MRKETDQRDAQTISLLWTSLLLFHGGDVTCFDACHVIWCGGHVIWCDVIACVVSCHVMQCDVMWCALMWCALQWSRCVFEVVLWQCGDPKYYSVLQSTTVYYKVLQRTTPVLLCTARYYSSTTLYCKVLLQHYSVLQSTTPVLLCTTKYYSSTTLYYNVLLQYYPVLQSTTPVLLCTAKYYSSTTLYYKVLLQYYSVLHSTTTYYSSTTLYYKAAFMIDPWHIWTVIYMIMTRHLQCAEQQESSSNFTKYCTCHAKWLWWLIRATYETSIYNARSNRSHNPTSPNTAPATQNESHDWSASHMKRHLQWAEQQESQSNFTKYCACHAKWFSWLIRVTYETSFTMRGATNVTGQVHQILRLPRKMNLMINPRHIWNVIYNARSKRSQPPTSPNTAPATQNESHDWSASDMKRHLECAEQAKSTSNLTKYCACHATWISWLIRVTYETSFRMRGASKVNLEPHQILRLPRKMHLMIDPRHIWNLI